jgi:hypothetical protein
MLFLRKKQVPASRIADRYPDKAQRIVVSGGGWGIRLAGSYRGYKTAESMSGV